MCTNMKGFNNVNFKFEAAKFSVQCLFAKRLKVAIN